MGLGKTLESIMLIVGNLPPRGWAVAAADADAHYAEQVGAHCVQNMSAHTAAISLGD